MLILLSALASLLAAPLFCPLSAQIAAPTACPPPAASSLEDLDVMRPALEGAGGPVFELRIADAPPRLDDDLDAESLLLALGRTRAFWSAKPPELAVELAGRKLTASGILKGLGRLEAILRAGERGRIAREFDFIEVAGEGGPGTVTGYYAPELAADLKPLERGVPILARPSDLLRAPPEAGLGFDYGRRDETGKLVPYYTRAEIAAGALRGRGLERLWVRHAVDLYVLQVQGSGWAVLPDGRRLHLAFDGANGHRYRNLGKALAECGLLRPGASYEEVLDFLRRQTPEREQELLNVSPRYVFFKPGPADRGPAGASGIELVAERSVAADPRFAPLGLPGFLASRRPVVDEAGRLLEYRDFSRFIAVHDVGSAIRGAGRLDLYFGAGRAAEAAARLMVFPGRFFLIVPRAGGMVESAR